MQPHLRASAVGAGLAPAVVCAETASALPELPFTVFCSGRALVTGVLPAGDGVLSLGNGSDAPPTQAACPTSTRRGAGGAADVVGQNHAWHMSSGPPALLCSGRSSRAGCRFPPPAPPKALSTHLQVKRTLSHSQSWTSKAGRSRPCPPPLRLPCRETPGRGSGG